MAMHLLQQTLLQGVDVFHTNEASSLANFLPGRPPCPLLQEESCLFTPPGKVAVTPPPVAYSLGDREQGHMPASYDLTAPFLSLPQALPYHPSPSQVLPCLTFRFI